MADDDQKLIPKEIGSPDGIGKTNGSKDSSVNSEIDTLSRLDQKMTELGHLVSTSRWEMVRSWAILPIAVVVSVICTHEARNHLYRVAAVAAIIIFAVIGAVAIVAVLEVAYRRRHGRESAELRKDIDGALGVLESLTGQASSPSVLNLQIVLRRMYDDSTKSGMATTRTADEVAGTARNVLRFAVIIAFCGWLTAVLCVLGTIPKVLRRTDLGIHEIWPALVATSGTVLLLIGIATLAYRFAQRSHDRARCHHDDAIRARRIDAAIRLLMMIEVRTGGTTAETDAGLRAFAMRLLDSASSRSDVDEISALPEAAAKIVEKVVDSASDVAKGLTKKSE